MGNYSFLIEGVGGVDTTLDTRGCLDPLAASGMTCSLILTEVNQTYDFPCVEAEEVQAGGASAAIGQLQDIREPCEHKVNRRS